MSNGKKIGTLVVVVLKARHLKDSHTFYKQDPYALVQFGGTENKTKVERRGGQHPVWDNEFHYPVFESESRVDTRMLKVAAYSKELKTDVLIGEGQVDVTQTLKTGEFDDWVKLEENGSFRGEIYLEMTFYSAAPPLARRASKLSPNDRLWRPPATPPKDKTSPNITPQRSPYLLPTMGPSTASPKLAPTPSLDLSPPKLPASLQPASGMPNVPREDTLLVGQSASSQQKKHPKPFSRHPDAPLVPPRKQDTPLPAIPAAPQQPLGDPTLRNIPYLSLGPTAETTKPAGNPQNLQHIPSILRPRNVKSSPIPLPAREETQPSTDEQYYDYADPHRRFQRELVESDTEFAGRLAQREGINLERLRQEEADAELARRLAQEEESGFRRGEESSIPGGWN